MGLYNHANARNEVQAAYMRELEENGICLFCPETLRSAPDQKVHFESEHWIVSENRFPYPDTKLHLLLIPQEHVRDMIDLSEEARDDFWDVLEKCRKSWSLGFYKMMTRCGDTNFTGATIEHLHLHLMVGDSFSEDHSPVRMTFSKKPL